MTAQFNPPLLQPFPLHGKIIVLTGGAGLFGRGLAAQIAEPGATLILASRNVEALNNVATAERARGFDVSAQGLDQADEASILRLRDDLIRNFGRVDGLVNNAVSRPMKNALAPLADWEASMMTNATGLFAIPAPYGKRPRPGRTGRLLVKRRCLLHHRPDSASRRRLYCALARGYLRSFVPFHHQAAQS